MTDLYIGHRIAGPLGVVKDAIFAFCHWPRLDKPTKLFADGSSGIQVIGAARNVWFPDDTQFLNYYPDALYPAELAVRAAFPGLRGLINLTPEQAAVWLSAYEEASAGFPVTHAVHSTKRDLLFLRHAHNIAPEGAKAVEEFYISELDTVTAESVANGTVDEDALRSSSDWHKANGPSPQIDPGVKIFQLSKQDGKDVVTEKISIDAGRVD